MNSTVDTTIASSKMPFPIVVIIDGDSPSYIGDGDMNMDKADEKSLPQYSRNNELLIVESSFIGTVPIKEVIKQLIFERNMPEIEVGTSTREGYTKRSSMVVVASNKEGSI